MILGLLGRLKIFAEPALLMVLGVYLAVMVFKSTRDLNAPSPIGPNSNMSELRDELTKVEARSNKYADDKTISTEKLMVAKHEEILRSLSVFGTQVERLTESTRILGQRIFELQRDKDRGRHVSYPGGL